MTILRAALVGIHKDKRSALPTRSVRLKLKVPSNALTAVHRPTLPILCNGASKAVRRRIETHRPEEIEFLKKLCLPSRVSSDLLDGHLGQHVRWLRVKALIGGELVQNEQVEQIFDTPPQLRPVKSIAVSGRDGVIGLPHQPTDAPTEMVRAWVSNNDAYEAQEFFPWHTADDNGAQIALVTQQDAATRHINVPGRIGNCLLNDRLSFAGRRGVGKGIEQIGARLNGRGVTNENAARRVRSDAKERSNTPHKKSLHNIGATERPIGLTRTERFSE